MSRIRFEIDVGLARRAGASDRHSLGDILEYASAPGGKERAFFQASEPGRVAYCVQAIGELLREYGTTILAGEPTAFDRMAEMSDRRNAAYTKEIVQRPIRTAAEEAWRKHDYLKVRNLYSRIQARPDVL